MCAARVHPFSRHFSDENGKKVGVVGTLRDDQHALVYTPSSFYTPSLFLHTVVVVQHTRICGGERRSFAWWVLEITRANSLINTPSSSRTGKGVCTSSMASTDCALLSPRMIVFTRVGFCRDDTWPEGHAIGIDSKRAGCERGGVTRSHEACSH